MSAMTTFDYGALPPADRDEMQVAVGRIRGKLSTIQRDFLAIGEELLRVKERVPHGMFAPWVETELQMTPRAAQLYMRAAGLVQSIPAPIRETVSHLPATTLYKLAAPSTPKEVVAEVVQAAEDGVLPLPPDIIQRIDEATREAREVAEVQKAKTGRTEAEAKKLLTRRRAAQAAAREKERQERAIEDAERARRRDELRSAVLRLVDVHPDAMRELARAIAASGPEASWSIRSYLTEAIATADAQERSA